MFWKAKRGVKDCSSWKILIITRLPKSEKTLVTIWSSLFSIKKHEHVFSETLSLNDHAVDNLKRGVISDAYLFLTKSQQIRIAKSYFYLWRTIPNVPDRLSRVLVVIGRMQHFESDTKVWLGESPPRNTKTHFTPTKTQIRDENLF